MRRQGHREVAEAAVHGGARLWPSRDLLPNETLLSAPPSPNVLDVATRTHDQAPRPATPARTGGSGSSRCARSRPARRPAASGRWPPRPRSTRAGRPSRRSARPPRRGPPGGRATVVASQRCRTGAVAAAVRRGPLQGGAAGRLPAPVRARRPGPAAAGPTLRAGLRRPVGARTLRAAGEGEPTAGDRHTGAGAPARSTPRSPWGPRPAGPAPVRTRTSCCAGRAGPRRGGPAIRGARRGPASGRPAWPGRPLRGSRGRASAPGRRCPRLPCGTRRPWPR